MRERRLSSCRILEMNAVETKPDMLNELDHLDDIRSRTRVLELALLGAHGSGMDLNSEPYRDAIIQQAQDIANGLDRLASSLKAAMRGAE